jgi:hypothetical protein
MQATVNHRPPGATPAHQTDADDAGLLPATLADLQALQTDCDCAPCWCPDAHPDDGGRHLANCHLPALERLVQQWTCNAGGGMKIGNGQAFECTCPTCRIEAVIADGFNRVVMEIRNLDLEGLMTSTSPSPLGGPRDDDPEAGVADELDLRERYRKVIRALERAGSGQGEDGKWNCAHPEHADEHPSMSVLKDNRTGKISFKCWSCGPPDGTPEKKEWTTACLKELGLPWAVMFPNRKAGDDYEPPF